MSSLTLRSPAKLNLFLKILHKRPDGYHNLRTLFERIDLCDELRFTSRKDGRIRIICDHPHVPTGPKNLIFRAALLLKRDFDVQEGVEIRLKKRIPVAAGLGGGSSNAATTIFGLNKLWKLSLSRDLLLRYGRVLGSDVPFFLYPWSWGVGTGRGDRIRSVNIAAKLWHILVVPGVKMYSREVFTALNLQLTKRNDNDTILIRSLKKKDIPNVKSLLFNHLETPILRIRPSLEKVRGRLRRLGVEGVAFSGSGPSVFGIVDSRQEAQRLKKILRKRYTQVFAVRTF